MPVVPAVAGRLNGMQRVFKPRRTRRAIAGSLKKAARNALEVLNRQAQDPLCQPGCRRRTAANSRRTSAPLPDRAGGFGLKTYAAMGHNGCFSDKRGPQDTIGLLPLARRRGEEGGREGSEKEVVFPAQEWHRPRAITVSA